MVKKEIIHKVGNSAIFVILVGLLLLGKTFLFYHNTIAVNETLEMQTIFGTICFIVSIGCFISILPNRTTMVVAIIIDFLMSLLLWADHIYYIFSNNVLSVAQIGNLQYGEEIASTLPMIIQPKQILYFLDILVIIGLWIGKILVFEKKEEKTKKELIIKTIVGIVGIGIFCFVGLTYIKNGEQVSYNKDLQIRKATILGYHISDITNSFTMKQQTKYKNKEDMQKAYQELEKYQLENDQLKGILENQNVIILQLESIQEFVLHKEINGKAITPNLNEFLEENIEFTNMHMQSYSTTADSEHSTITSLYPVENGMCFSKYGTNTYDDIFKLFHQKQYHTSYMHGNYPYFWNRGNVYGRLNIKELVFKEQFEDLSENINGDLSDELFYKQAIEKWKKYQTPFFSYIVSVSSHIPFTLEGLQDRSKITIDVGKYKNTYFGNYLEAVNYADYAFGELIKGLKKEGIYEQTSILVFGDHNGLTMYDEELIDFLNTNRKQNITEVEMKLNYTKVAAGLKIPGIKSKKIEKPINKLDIKPTLAYLCNLEDKFSLGNNIFSNKDAVYLNNERIITKKYYYDEQWYDIQTGEKLDWEKLEIETKEKLNKYYQEMKKQLDISNSVIIHNLLK